MLSATASAAQLAEHRFRFARSRIRFPTGWHKVAFSQQIPVGDSPELSTFYLLLRERNFPMVPRERQVTKLSFAKNAVLFLR